MKFTSINLSGALILLTAFIMLSGGEEAQAQFEFKWVNVGAMQSPYSTGGANKEQEPFDNAPNQFPAVDHRAGNSRAQALWFGSRNFTDENGRSFSFKTAGIGPRAGGATETFANSSEAVYRFEPTSVTVDGAQSFLRFTNADRIDPSIPADQLVHIVHNNQMGITVDQKIYGWSQQYHDNYHIIEYEFTNTGDVDNDPEPELNAPLEDVYFYFISRYAVSDAASWVNGNGAPWGKFTMNDAVGDGHRDYGVDFRAQYAWYGHNVFQPDYNVLGGPLWAEHWTSNQPPDTSGRLHGAHFVGRVYIHADASTTDRSDDPNQPSTMGVKGSDDPDLVVDGQNDDLMMRQYQNFMEAGRMFPHHADQIEPDGPEDWPRNFATPNNDPATFQGVTDEGGWAMVEGFGPYDMAPGESVNLVIAEGVAGLSQDARAAIGAAYKASGGNDDLQISYDYGSTTHTMTKNLWVMTSRDSLFQTFERAIANYNSGYNIPNAPLPPASFAVTSGTDEIRLVWTTLPGASQTGWEVYRVESAYQNIVDYELVASLDAGARTYSDAGVQRGLNYFYYLQAVGSVNSDGTGNTPTGAVMKSGRYFTQTYLPANLKRAAGSLAEARVVPNPYNIASEEGVRWPGVQDRLGFLDIPGNCTIKIYTQIGELVDEIVHDDGSGDEFWDHTTASRQIVSSGLYIAVITDLDTGESEFKKFVIIR